MAAPQMVSDNVLARMQREIERLAAELARVTTALGVWENATITRGDITVKNGGGIRLLDGGSFISEDGFVRSVNTAANGGAQLQSGSLFFLPDLEDFSRFGYIRIATGDDAGNNMWIRPPQDSTTSGSPTRVILRGPGGGLTGAFWLYSDGPGTINTVGRILMDSDERIDLVTPRLGLYELPTTSSAANLHLGTIGGQWTVGYITSSRRYKQDIEDAPIDPEAALSWRPRVWRDKADVEAVGDDSPTHIGFIAEEIDEVSPEFVLRDEEGAPNALAYDRMVAGLTATVQAQQAQIDAQADQIAALIDANTALAHRVKTLEAGS